MGKRSRRPRQVPKRFADAEVGPSSALRTASYFKERAARADVGKALDLLDRAGDAPPWEGDAITG